MEQQIQKFRSAVIYCIKLSWAASPYYTVIRCLLLLVSNLIPFVSIYASKLFLDLLTTLIAEEPYYWTRLFASLIVIYASNILAVIIFNISQYIQSIYNELLTNHINKKLMEKTLRMDMEFFDSPDYLDALQAVMMDAMSIAEMLWNIFTGIGSCISLVIAAVMIGAYNWVYAFVIVLASIPSAVMNQKFARALYGWHLENLSEERKISYMQSLANNKAYASDIRLFNLGSNLINRYQNLWNYCFQGRKKLRRKQMLLSIPAAILPEFFVLAIIILITQGIVTGENTIGDYSLFTGLFASLTAGLTSFIGSFSSVYKDRLKVDTIREFESRKNHIADQGIFELSEDVEVEFREVSFHYPNSSQMVLDHISFEIHAKEKICLIGVNGAGKSTIIKLLLRFYDVTGGEIIINGRNIKEYTIESLRRCFSTFFQEYAIYAFTIRENIQLSDADKKDQADQKTWASLELSGAKVLMEKTTKGLDTYLHRIFDNEGYEPSGGESQKIALARAIYRNCRFIIFDEPSAFLDPDSEYKLFEQLAYLMEDKTALFTSHRLSAVHLANRIFLIDNGQIAEQGTHDELMKQKGEYCRLYTLQKSKYK